jgi:hypothetical protein
MNQKGTNSSNGTTIRNLIKDELYNSKFIKSGLIVGAGVIGLFALGFLFKTINYTVDNFKNLSATLKR